MRESTDAAGIPVSEIEALSALPTASVYEAMGQKGAMGFAIKPIYPGMRVCGPSESRIVLRGPSLPG